VVQQIWGNLDPKKRGEEKEQKSRRFQNNTVGVESGRRNSQKKVAVGRLRVNKGNRRKPSIESAPTELIWKSCPKKTGEKKRRVRQEYRGNSEERRRTGTGRPQLEGIGS